jgi:transmembrane sensor
MAEPIDWTLLARYLSDECSDEEKTRAEARLATDPEARQLVDSMRAAWETPEPQVGTPDVQRMWARIADRVGISEDRAARQRSEHQGSVLRIARWFRPGMHPIRRYAAAAVLLIAASIGFQWAQRTGVLPWGNQAVQYHTIAVERGARDEVVLSDGTRIALDAGSRLRYPETFVGDTREVYLTGEGYFAVTASPDRPFVVHANHAMVKVLGTRFNVRAWQQDQRVTVAVEEGTVSLGSEGAVEEGVVIDRGMVSTLPGTGRPSEPRAADIGKHLGWMRNEAFFDSAPLSEVLHQLERWHRVRIVLEDTTVKEDQLTLHIQAKSLDNALELISALTGLGCERSADTVRLRPATGGAN